MSDRFTAIRNLVDHFPEMSALHSVNRTKFKNMQACELEAMECSKHGEIITIGVEVEVRWRSYFPELWKNHLEGKVYSELSYDEKELLTKLCDAEEAILLPKLKATERLGIPKGKDKYYEFALEPAHHPSVIWYELELLKAANLIPDNMKHSLHITLGGMEANKDAYLMLMCLELLGYSSTERLCSAAVTDKAVLWGRRGRAGIRERESYQMKLGKTTGIELRTLELPTDQKEIEYLLFITWMMANYIKNKDRYPAWNNVVLELEGIAENNNIDISKNWGRPYENPEVWIDFANKIPHINTRPLLRAIIDMTKYE